ncbi:hypothetical protein [Rhabdochromatium marinum]|uniref:hypothetical protein n=1 Tax=Rhabdochromatium marinum TaxID=48729 RepID=UPI001905C162|nr:hypothetical protein [Rhabdochromatium marinum]MBK1647213.1 hypothetical protein [Rhabdochromatium marinum]
MIDDLLSDTDFEDECERKLKAARAEIDRLSRDLLYYSAELVKIREEVARLKFENQHLKMTLKKASDSDAR